MGPEPWYESKILKTKSVYVERQSFVTGDVLQVGESYMVYENEILHNREMITDGPNFISRESQFK